MTHVPTWPNQGTNTDPRQATLRTAVAGRSFANVAQRRTPPPCMPATHTSPYMRYAHLPNPAFQGTANQRPSVRWLVPSALRALAASELLLGPLSGWRVAMRGEAEC